MLKLIITLIALASLAILLVAYIIIRGCILRQYNQKIRRSILSGHTKQQAGLYLLYSALYKNKNTRGYTPILCMSRSAHNKKNEVYVLVKIPKGTYPYKSKWIPVDVRKIFQYRTIKYTLSKI